MRVYGTHRRFRTQGVGCILGAQSYCEYRARPLHTAVRYRLTASDYPRVVVDGWGKASTPGLKSMPLSPLSRSQRRGSNAGHVLTVKETTKIRRP